MFPLLLTKISKAGVTQQYIPRKYHNAPLVITDFTSQQTVYVPIGSRNINNPEAIGEYFTISNQGDPTTKPNLILKILDDVARMIVMGSPSGNTTVDNIVLPYGSTVTIAKIDNTIRPLSVIQHQPFDYSAPSTRPVKWTLKVAEGESVDAEVSFIYQFNAAGALNLPKSSANGDVVGAFIAPGIDALVAVAPSDGDTINGANEGWPITAPAPVKLFMFDGEKNWVLLT